MTYTTPAPVCSPQEYFLSVLSQPRERRESTLDGGQGLGSAGGPRPKSFAKRWMSRNFVSKARTEGVAMQAAAPGWSCLLLQGTL